ncbi:MAG: TetR/AcrR family transcriptional regulator [Parvularculaceae bacterium]
MAARGEATREKLLAAAEAIILKNGYAGATIDEVIAETGATKGAFFHHFKSKADLARAVVERYTENDFALFREWSARADRLSDDPLERVLIFLKLFEEFLDGLGAPFPGCIFASYTLETHQFDDPMRAYLKEKFGEWIAIFEIKLEALVEASPPARPVTARALAEMIGSIIEGGFILAKAFNDKDWVQRQCAEYRAYIEMLFRR